MRIFFWIYFVNILSLPYFSTFTYCKCIDDSTLKYKIKPKRLVDIKNTTLFAEIDWNNELLNARAELLFVPYNQAIDSFSIDAKGFSINRVAIKKNGVFINIKFSYDNTKIFIKSDSLLSDSFKILVDYIANPSMLYKNDIIPKRYQGLYFINSDNSSVQIKQQAWSLNQTESASCWFPTIDSPEQKMTQDFYITVKKNQIALANGELVYTTLNHKKDSSITYYWKLDKPNSPYLSCIIVGNINKYQSKNDSVCLYSTNKLDSEQITFINEKTIEIIQFIENKIKIKYPWTSYNQVLVDSFISNGMENTGLSVYSNEIINMNKIDIERLLIHEAAHQWFGNLVTCNSWSNLTLNESFASYFEYLWIESYYSQNLTDSLLLTFYKKYIHQKNTFSRPLIWNYYKDADTELFDAITYSKGALLIHSLRKNLGDSLFFEAINSYLKKYSFSSVDYTNLQDEFENASGEDLRWFFNQWFLSKTDPEINLKYTYDSCEFKLIINIEQVISTDFGLPFYLPLNIIIGDDSITKFFPVILDSYNNLFEFQIDFAPSFVIIDEWNNLLIGVKYNNENNLFDIKQRHNYLVK